jgi:ACS family hexuronate transporter-like MFS transporter
MMGVTVVNYLDRTCLAVAAPHLKAKLAVNEIQYSRIISAFQLTYAAMQPIAGRIIDWLDVRLGLAMAIACWSVAQMLTGFASGWRSFAACRAALGVGEAANFPGGAKVVSQWFPPRERTMATGLFNVGSGIGQAIATPLVAFIISRFDWPMAFVVTGAAGSVWVALWWAVYRHPEQHPWMSPRELGIVRGSDAQGSQEALRPEQGTAATPDRQAWRTVLADRNFWALGMARFLSEPAWQFFTYWIPLYLATERHMRLKDIGYFAWIPFIAADLGALFGGVLSPLFLRMGASVLTARKLSATVCAVLMVPAVFIGTAKSAGLAIAFFCAGAFAHQAMSSTLLTLPADLFPQRAVATANGLSGTVGFLGGMGFTMIVGVVAMKIGYAPLFVAIALFDLVGSSFLWILLRAPREIRVG